MPDKAILDQLPILNYVADTFDKLASETGEEEQKKTLSLIAGNLRATIVCARAAARKTTRKHPPHAPDRLNNVTASPA
jgi:hypothetical protein